MYGVTRRTLRWIEPLIVTTASSRHTRTLMWFWQKAYIHQKFVYGWRLVPKTNCSLIFDTTIDQFNYCDLLQNHLMPQLRAKRIKLTTIFQHDGAPPHFSLRIREFLSKQFSANRLIGRGFGHPWPPRSPDLSPLDYYFWGTLKARLYHNFKPTSPELWKRKSKQKLNQ